MSGQPDVSACPVCGRSDWSQPIQAVVDSQTSRTSGYGTSVGVGFGGGRVVPVVASHLSSSTAQSPLAQMLDLPYPRRPWYQFRGHPLLLVPVLVAQLAWMMMALGSMIETADSSSSWPEFFVILLLVCLGMWTIRRHRRDNSEWRRKVGRWERAWAVWITLRYCHRDHVVYKGPDVTIEPAMLQKFLYAQIGQQPGVSGTQRA